MLELEPLVKLVKVFKTHLVTSNIDTIKYVSSLLPKLNHEIKVLRKNMKHINMEDFIHDNQAHLFMIHNALVGDVSKTYISDASTRQNLRTVHDALFSIFNIKVPKKRFAHLPTWLATNFCKGITFFENNVSIHNVPFYHRTQSCGSKIRTATEMLIESPNEHKHTYLRNCFIERKIYDAIYTNTMHQQDIKHLYELKVIEQLYQNAYPDERLHIQISYFDDDIHPCCLHMYIQNKEQTTIEIYQRFMDNNKLVYCKRITPDGKIYEKYQDYHQEQPFLLKTP